MPVGFPAGKVFCAGDCVNSKNRFFRKDFLNKAYDLLNDVTPLDYDCGRLCDGKCCKGDQNDGMILFPGEKEFFVNEPDFEVRYDEKYSAFAVYCKGRCDRNKRPLACRIFPFMFYLSSENKKKHITVAKDIRAKEECAILQSDYDISKNFMRRMRMTEKKAETDSEVTDFIRELTFLLTDFGEL